MALRPAPPDTTIQLPPLHPNPRSFMNPVITIPPRIFAMKADAQHAYFDNIFYHLQSRAAGHYAGQSYDTLTLLEKFTIDNHHAAARGMDLAQNIWKQRYGQRLARLHWTFHSLKDFIKFGVDYFYEYPGAEITIHLSLPVDLPAEQRRQHHQRCRRRARSQGYHCCEMCALSFALQTSSSDIAIYDDLNPDLPEGQRHLAVVVGEERIEFMDACKVVDGQWRTVELEVSGRLGVVFAETDWEQFTLV